MCCIKMIYSSCTCRELCSAGSTVAPGDSGGGLAYPDHRKRWYLRGIVSVGSLSSSARNDFSFFTNVTMFVPWMAGIVNDPTVCRQLFFT